MRSDSTPTYCSLKCPPPIHPLHSIVTESEGAEETGRLKAETRESDWEKDMGWGVGVGPFAANCSSQANGKPDG